MKEELQKIESDIRAFVRLAYPAMEVRAEYRKDDPTRIALYFIDERFRSLYRRQRYHYLLHLIPKKYYDEKLTDTIWFELAPDEVPEEMEDEPDDELIKEIASDVIGTLHLKGFFNTLDHILHPLNSQVQLQTCSGDFNQSKCALTLCGIDRQDWSEIFHVLMSRGAYCDCEVLFNAAPESRMRGDHWLNAAKVGN